jgi:hypothetical protein
VTGKRAMGQLSLACNQRLNETISQLGRIK